MKLFIVNLLERACKLFHWLPPHMCRLAVWSLRLNDKWDTEAWIHGDRKSEEERW